MAMTFKDLCDDAKTRIVETSVDELNGRLDGAGKDFDLIDVREESEFAAGHIPGARQIGRGILERDIASAIPDTDREIVLYCGGGNRSALSADYLQRMGYTKVRSMAGGWKAWTGPKE